MSASSFDERWPASAIEALATVAAVDATINARTLARAGLEPTLPSTSAPSPSSKATKSRERATLPRLSIAPAKGPASAGAPHGGPDLEIVALLGEGGMGRVQLARQRSLGREVAIKTAISDSAEAADALLAEARVSGALEHPGVIPVHVLGQDEHDRPVLVMKRVEGAVWRELLRDDTHPAWARLAGARTERLERHLEILMQVCNAVEFAHARGVLHRDIKPENVMVGEFGEVYLLDWGVACRLADPVGERAPLVGTPAYMAPEMCGARGGRVDARTDVYLLGATLHEILSGSPRHAGASLREVLAAAWESRPIDYPPSVPEDLAALARRATSADPDERPVSAFAFRAAIADSLRHAAATRLAHSARARLEAAQAQVSTGGDAAGVYRALTEARFGFRQSLVEAPHHALAERGLAATLSSLFDLELAQRNPSAARAILDEMAAPDQAQRRRLAALESQLAAERDRLDRFARHEQAEDANVSVGARLKTSAMTGLATLAISSVALTRWYRTRAELPYSEMIVISLVFFGLVAGGTLVARRALFANAFNRRLSLWMLSGTMLLVVSRVVGARGAGLETPRQMAADSVLLAAVVSMVASTGYHRMFAVAALLVAMAWCCVTLPVWAPVFFVAGTVVVVASLPLVWGRRR